MLAANRELGGLVAMLGGLDAIVFTAGIGEHSSLIRGRICAAAIWLGVELDPIANTTGLCKISKPVSRVSIWIIPTNEELMLARHTQDLLINQVLTDGQAEFANHLS